MLRPRSRLLTALICGGLMGFAACGAGTVQGGAREAGASELAFVDARRSDARAIDAAGDGPGDARGAPDAAPPPQRAVQYVGYFASAFDGHGTGDYSVDTAAAGANLTFIWTTTQNLAAKLTVARSVNQKAVVLLQNELFDWTGGLSLRPDWRTRWDAMASVVESGHADTVVAFYPIDEPYWNAYSRGVSDDTMRGWLVEIAAAVHQRFPTKAVGTILAVGALHNGLGSSYVSMFDWVGFDCYGAWDDCAGKSMTWYVTTLGSWLTAKQRLISVPEAFLWGTTGTSLEAQHTVVTRLNRWHQLLLSDPRFLGVVPFYWPTMDLNGDGRVDTGAKDLPWIKERVFQLAESLLHPERARVFPVDESASSSYATSLPFAATDRDDTSAWNAGGEAPQWIAFDLGEVHALRRIELLTTQVPSGATTHLIEGSVDNAAWAVIGTLSATTEENQLLQWTGSASARWVRVRTTVSPSWVGWREVRFFK